MTPTNRSSRESRLEALGYAIDRTPLEAGLVEPLVVVERFIYVSGQVPFEGRELTSKGKVPSAVSIEEATAAAARCAANCIRAVVRHLGSLDLIERVVRITGYVNADPDFTDEHLVMNGASQLVREVFGDAGRHARTALGMAQLPLGASTEVEMILLLRGDTQ